MIKKTALFFMLVCLLSFTCLAQTFETMKKYQICTPGGLALEVRDNGDAGTEIVLGKQDPTKESTLQKKVSYGVWLRLK